ncbi:response regulator [Ideonella sp.]|uniref:response regulator n=1 Tax=Ideonella sp. TaxID=1929293 RepID=UPI0035AF0865
MDHANRPELEPDDDFTTVQVAKLLGMAVRSVQLMVDRGELEGWKTPGGHRRISRASVERALALRGGAGHRREAAALPAPHSPQAPAAVARPRALLIEDSVHFQNLVSLLIRQRFPQVDLHVASDGITGLAMVGRLEPDVLLVDILLPGIDGAALVTSLRSSPQFSGSQLIVVTSLDESQRAPFAYALDGLPVVHKSRLVAELPPLFAACLARIGAHSQAAP